MTCLGIARGFLINEDADRRITKLVKSQVRRIGAVGGLHIGKHKSVELDIQSVALSARTRGQRTCAVLVIFASLERNPVEVFNPMEPVARLLFLQESGETIGVDVEEPVRDRVGANLVSLCPN